MDCRILLPFFLSFPRTVIGWFGSILLQASSRLNPYIQRSCRSVAPLNSWVSSVLGCLPKIKIFLWKSIRKRLYSSDRNLTLMQLVLFVERLKTRNTFILIVCWQNSYGAVFGHGRMLDFFFMSYLSIFRIIWAVSSVFSGSPLLRIAGPFGRPTKNLVLSIPILVSPLTACLN